MRLTSNTAMVTKVSARSHGGEVRLKAAASFADSGDIRDAVEELWKGAEEKKKKTLIDTVSPFADRVPRAGTDWTRKLTFFSNVRIRRLWSPMTLYQIPKPL